MDQNKPGLDSSDIHMAWVGCRLRARSGRNRISFGIVPPTGNTASNVPRGTIGRFSARSRGRMCSYLSDTFAQYRYMGTLTVADDVLDASEFKAAADRYFVWQLRYMRGSAEEPDLQSIFWFLEFQRRGAPHLHLFYTEYVPWECAASVWSRRIDQPWAFATSTKFEKLREGRAGTIGYAIKYAAKSSQKALPEDVDGYGRFWGVRGYRATMSADIFLEIDSTNSESVYEIVSAIREHVERGTEVGDVSFVPWEYGDGLIAWRSGGDWDAFGAESRWREGVEIQFSKLCALGASVLRDEPLVEV